MALSCVNPQYPKDTVDLEENKSQETDLLVGPESVRSADDLASRYCFKKLSYFRDVTRHLVPSEID